jgi:hypothetical protein
MTREQLDLKIAELNKKALKYPDQRNSIWEQMKIAVAAYNAASGTGSDRIELILLNERPARMQKVE